METFSMRSVSYEGKSGDSFLPELVLYRSKPPLIPWQWIQAFAYNRNGNVDDGDFC
jgi:hypothetical protein